MINNFEFPEIYKKLESLGYFDLLGWPVEDNPNYLWIPYIHLMKIDAIKQFKMEELKENCIPFAKVANGDIWVWYIENNTSKIGLCYHDDEVGIFYSNNIEEFIFRQIIEFLASAFFCTNKEKESSDISEIEAKEILKDWINKLEKFFPENWIAELNNIGKLPLKFCDNKNYGKNYAFLTWDEADKIINKFINFEDKDKEFIWSKK